MLLLPDSTELGSLRFVESFVDYDFPRIFSCVNATGQLYLALSILDDEETRGWYYLPISPSRLSEVTTGELPLRDAFCKSENGGVFYVLENLGENISATVTYLSSYALADSDLPAESACLDPIEPHIDYTDRFNATFIARTTHRETLNFVFEPPDKRDHEIAARTLGNAMTALQGLADAIGQYVKAIPTLKGKIAAGILAETQLNVVETFPSSFGVNIRAEQVSDLLGHSTLVEVFGRIKLLIDAGSDSELLDNELYELKGRVASRYRDLLRVLSVTGSDLRIQWGSVDPAYGGEAHISNAEIILALDLVERLSYKLSDEIIVVGPLIGLNARTKRFEISDEKSSTRYVGEVEDVVQLSITKPTIENRYKYTLREQLEIHPVSGFERTSWVLVNIETPTPTGDA